MQEVQQPFIDIIPFKSFAVMFKKVNHIIQILKSKTECESINSSDTALPIGLCTALALCLISEWHKPNTNI